MSDVEQQNSLQTVFSSAIDLAADNVTSVPAPIRNTALKAIGQLAATYIDRLTAKLERKPAITRAQTAGEVLQIQAINSSIANQIDVPSAYVESVMLQHVEKTVRYKQNVEKICGHALQELKEPWLEEEPISSIPSGPEVSDDWLCLFESEAERMSSDYMQKVFGKVLAREICKPGSVSLRTVRLAAQLDRSVAEQFANFCSMACFFEGNDENFLVLMTAGKDPRKNGLADFGLSYRVLLALVEYGLINAEWDSVVPVLLSDSDRSIDFMYCGEKWEAIDETNLEVFRKFNLRGITATIAGSELFSAVSPIRNVEYEKMLFEHWKSQHFRLQPGSCDA